MAAKVLNPIANEHINIIYILYVGLFNVPTYICIMEIEKAIKQQRFDSEMEKAVINILYTSSWISYDQVHILKRFDLSMQQYNILRILKGQHPKTASVNLLIDRMIDKSSNASRIVEKLRVKEMASRIECPEDRRRVDIAITEKGLKIVALASKEMKHLEILNGALTDQEASQLNLLLNKIRKSQIEN